MTYRLEHTDQYLINVHEPDKCQGQPCTVHNKTNHHMRSFTQNWRVDMGLMERICTHSVGHPDPDESLSVLSQSVHSCDGCCAPLDAA